MTFLDDLKKQIIDEHERGSCCRRAMLNGIVLSKGTLVDGMISISLGNRDAIDHTAELVHELFGQTAAVNESAVGGRRRILSFRSPAMEKYLKGTDADINRLYLRKCASCDAAFMKGIFLAAGRMTTIGKKCTRLEIAPVGRNELISSYFESQGIALSALARREEKILYTGNTTVIEDFFALLGLNSATFALMNNKIEKEFKNAANRQRNCEMNNIQKTVTASGRVLNAINALIEANLLSTLPEELENTALLRLQYPDYSLARLASQFTPPISKPGLSHRLNKIVEFADGALGKRDN